VVWKFWGGSNKLLWIICMFTSQQYHVPEHLKVHLYWRKKLQYCIPWFQNIIWEHLCDGACE
jgi:hypothetical protein